MRAQFSSYLAPGWQFSADLRADDMTVRGLHSACRAVDEWTGPASLDANAIDAVADAIRTAHTCPRGAA